jgi:hypothetical protein
MDMQLFFLFLQVLVVSPCSSRNRNQHLNSDDPDAIANPVI